MYVTDLSFNNIDEIEGLDRLVKLEDLTLYNNRIRKIQNMDALSELHVLSLGNNELEELENVTPKYIVNCICVTNLFASPPRCNLDTRLMVTGK